MNPNVYNDPAALLDAADESVTRLELVLARHAELTKSRLYDQGVQTALTNVRNLVRSAGSQAGPAIVWTNGMDEPDEHGFVALQVVEEMRAEWVRGDVLDQQFAKRFAKRFAIQDALSTYRLGEQQRASVQLNCSQARFMSAMLGGSASTPTWPAYRLTRDDLGFRLGPDEVPEALALASAMTRGATVITPGVTLATVPQVVLRLRELFRRQNANVTNWGDQP